MKQRWVDNGLISNNLFILITVYHTRTLRKKIDDCCCTGVLWSEFCALASAPIFKKKKPSKISLQRRPRALKKKGKSVGGGISGVRRAGRWFATEPTGGMMSVRRDWMLRAPP